MQNAAFAAAGLDWEYVALDVLAARSSRRRCAGSRGRLGRRERHHPAQARRGALCDEAEGDVGEHARLRAGAARLQHGQGDRRAGSTSRAGLPDRREAARRRRCGRRSGEVRRLSRRGEWPPDADGCDLVVNATPVRDELLVEPQRGADVVDLAYGGDGETALVRRRARRAAARSWTASRRSSGRARRASSCWTGVPCPRVVARDARAGLLGLPR